MVIELLVQACLQVDFVGLHHEFLANLNRWLLADLRRCVHDFSYGQAHRVSLVRFVIGMIAYERFQLVVDAARFARVAGGWLQRHRGWTVRWQLEIEWKRVRAELFD